MQRRPILGTTFRVHPLRQQKFHHAAVIEARGRLQGGLLVLALGRIDQVGAVDQHPPQSLQLPRLRIRGPLVRLQGSRQA